MHVSFHQLSDNVDVLVVSPCGRLGHVQHLDNVFVVKELEQADLPDNTFRIDEILKRLWHLLDGNFLVRYVIISATDDTVCAVSDLLDVLELLIDAERRSWTSKQASENYYRLEQNKPRRATNRDSVR